MESILEGSSTMADIKEIKRIKKRMKKIGCDTVVRCKKCGMVQYLNFVDGLKNGWLKCCGRSTTIIVCSNEVIKKYLNVASPINPEIKFPKKPVMLTTPFNVTTEEFIRKQANKKARKK